MASNIDTRKKKNICTSANSDWAPEFVLLHYLDFFDALKIKTIFSVSHPTGMNSEIDQSSDNFEIAQLLYQRFA